MGEGQAIAAYFAPLEREVFLPRDCSRVWCSKSMFVELVVTQPVQ